MHPLPAHSEFGMAMRLLLRCVERSTAGRVVATQFLAAAGGLLAGLTPVALKGLVDAAHRNLTLDSAWSPMATAAFAYLSCLAADRLVIELRPAWASSAEHHILARLRLIYFEHALALPLAFHLDRPSGAVAHVLQQGLAGYQVVLTSLVNGFVPVLVEGLTMAAVLYSLRQPTITLIFAATAIAYLAASLRLGRRLRAHSRQVADASAMANSIQADGLLNIEPVKCFGRETHLVKQLSRSTTAVIRTWAGLHQLRWRNGLALTGIFAMSMAASLAIAIDACRHGTLTVGGFVLATMYMVQIIRPLDMLASASRDVAQALAFIRPMLDVFAQKREAEGDPSALATLASMPGRGAECHATQAHALCRADARVPPPRLSFQGITLAFANCAPVLNGLTLDIRAGGTTGIVGASGSGKSSLIRILARLCEAHDGIILIDGVPIDALAVETLRSMIAVIPQDTVLFNASVRDNIAVGKEGATAVEIERAARLAQLHDVIAALPAGYDTPIGERGLKLSGGERQRIAIARALLRDPQILVLDEATSMLDSDTEDAILRSLRQTSSGRTTISIAHRMTALRHADEIVVLHEGKVAEQGQHGALLARGGLYAAMWRAQQLTNGARPARV